MWGVLLLVLFLLYLLLLLSLIDASTTRILLIYFFNSGQQYSSMQLANHVRNSSFNHICIFNHWPFGHTNLTAQNQSLKERERANTNEKGGCNRCDDNFRTQLDNNVRKRSRLSYKVCLVDVRVAKWERHVGQDVTKKKCFYSDLERRFANQIIN